MTTLGEAGGHIVRAGIYHRLPIRVADPMPRWAEGITPLVTRLYEFDVKLTVYVN